MFMSRITYNELDGETDLFEVPFPFLEREHIYVTVIVGNSDVVMCMPAMEWATERRIRLLNMPPVGSMVEIQRKTPNDHLWVEFIDGAVLREADLDLMATQLLYVTQEAFDALNNDSSVAARDQAAEILTNVQTLYQEIIQTYGRFQSLSVVVHVSPTAEGSGTFDFENGQFDLYLPQGAESGLAVSDRIDLYASDVAASARAVAQVNAKVIEVESQIGHDVLAGTVLGFTGTFGGSDNKRPIPLGQTEADEQWALCDGSNGTPDLRDRFLVSAGAHLQTGDTGGSDLKNILLTVSTSKSNTSIQGTTMSNATMAAHQHAIMRTSGLSAGDGNALISGTSDGSFDRYSSVMGESRHHGHELSDSGHQHSAIVSDFDIRPSYYALAFIMKLPQGGAYA